MPKKTQAANVRLLPDPNSEAVQKKRRCPASGSKNEAFANVVLRQAQQALWLAHSDTEYADRQMEAAVIAMAGMSPKDEIEGMLAAQMVGIHNAAMECLRRAMIDGLTSAGRESSLSQANKLSRTYTAQMDALSRYRGKGQQKMTVEHVHVHAGGQAIVGNVTHPEGGGVATKTEEQPHAKQSQKQQVANAKRIEHQPEHPLEPLLEHPINPDALSSQPALRGKNPKRQPVPIPCDA